MKITIDPINDKSIILTVQEKGKIMYLVVWFDSGWSEVIVRKMENKEAAEELLTECEDNMDCIDPKIIVLCPW